MSEPADSDITPPAEKKGSLLRRALIAFAVVGVLGVLTVTIGGAVLYQAATAELPEYEELIAEIDELEATGELDKQRQELESQVAALYSEAQSTPRWSSVVTSEQLNGWLAMQLPVDFPKLASRGIRKPRLLLDDGVATIACRARVRGVDTVVAIAAAPIVTDDGWVGAELQSLKIGRLPLPLATLTELFDRAVRSANASPEGFRYRWTEENGNPVLLLNVEHLASTADQTRRVDTIEIRDGELLIGGVTEPRDAPPVAEVAAAADEPTPQGLPSP